jgi:hypothetical protein
MLAFLVMAVLLMSVGVADAAVLPTISGLSPNSGPIKGGNTVTITGFALADATVVKFGATPATSFTVVSNTQIDAVAPARPIGQISVRVTTPAGTTRAVPASKYTYNGPSLTSLSPASSTVAGGVTVTLVGTRLTGAEAVHFGPTPGTNVTVIDDNTVTVTAPARPAGTVNVKVTTPEGQSRLSPGGKFTYIAPAVMGLTPNAGPMVGGTTVIISGTALGDATAVKFGATPAASFTIDSDSQITAVSPARPAGMVDVKVTTPAGTSRATIASKFTYLGPAVTGLSPNGGPAHGGTEVTISGSRFSEATTVKFGPTQADFTVIDNNTIVAIAPTRPLGGVHVRVTSGEGVSRTNAADVYTYQ